MDALALYPIRPGKGGRQTLVRDMIVLFWKMGLPMLVDSHSWVGKDREEKLHGKRSSPGAQLPRER